MLQKPRVVLDATSSEYIFSSDVEVDETYIGGKKRIKQLQEA